MNISDYKFTFETEQEYLQATTTGYIPEFDIVRVEVQTPACILDIPFKSREEFTKWLAELSNGSIKAKPIRIYQSQHSFDIFDYCD